MNIKNIIVLGILLFWNLMSYAQDIKKTVSVKTIEIEGKIISEDDNLPISGATILIKGSNKGVASNFDGLFKIYANQGDVLVISSMGFSTKEYTIKDTKNIIIYLETNVEALKLVTVIGYGIQEKRDLTGAIGTLKGDKIDQTAVSFDNALTGKISGVQVMSSSGSPGSATSITIRGISSLNSNSNNPLIVIDGVPIYGSNRSNNTTDFERGSVPFSGFGGTSVASPLEHKSEFERNPLSMLNLNDIESIEVLKDAYATAIYGSRGATGVILITTKKAKSKKTRVSLSTSTTFSDPINKPELLNAKEYSKVYNEFLNSENQNAFPVNGNETNWLDNVLRTGITSSTNLSVDKKGKKLSYYFSSSHLKQNSYIVNQDYEKFNTRLNIDYDFSDKLKIGLNGTFSFSDNDALNAPSIYRNAILKAPNVHIYSENEDYYFGLDPNSFGTIDNPIAQAYKDLNYVKDNRIIGNAYMEYKPIGWLTLKSEVGIDHYNSDAYSRIISRPDIVGGNATERDLKNEKFVINNTATIVKVFNTVHSINSTLGQSFETSREKSLAVNGREFANDDILDIHQAGIVQIVDPIVREWALFSAFARFNYQYNHKYLGGITYRIDGSSRFNKNNRYIGFPSFSLGWRASEEKFIKKLDWVNELKFRGSIGFSGIDGSSGYYGNQGRYKLLRAGGSLPLNYYGSEILQVEQPNNPNLEWERTKTLDLGVDIDLFDERFSVTVDYYHKKINNLLYASAVPWYQGYALQQQNIGDMENKGWEVQLNTENIRTHNFKWITSFNISRNTNKILKLNFEGNDVTGAELGYKYFAEGKSAGQFFLYDWDGVDALTGNPVWNYPDGSQSTTPPQTLENPSQYRKPMGDALPDFYGGLTNSFSYKNWKLDAFFTFSSGNQLYNGTKALLYTYTTDKAHNLSKDILDYWLITGHRTTIPKLNNSSIVSNGFGSGAVDYTAGRDSDRFLEDASYIRLKNIKVSYSLPQEILNDLHLNDLSIFIQGNNLLTFTNYSGLDPEVSAFGSSALLSGYDELTMPQSKSYSLGVNIGF
ncbi:SusC/RagA family TonB-linked outer membrane protein [Cellulophaga omnivescoria]|uniref:SusC/RagA family TonB-linked outer membrane protein n=1 Tax=Cellulophaga omnivescoria TaxID=1888890 RepID=UPI000984853E|nr:TonB-dependent receptor [Cellulophaga omnivescoria]